MPDGGIKSKEFGTLSKQRPKRYSSWACPAELFFLKIDLDQHNGGARGIVTPVMKPLAEQTSPDISCPSCAAPMRHVATLPKFGAHPELRTFRCAACRHVETVVHPGPRPSS
jgi:hypothetical protein